MAPSGDKFSWGEGLTDFGFILELYDGVQEALWLCVGGLHMHNVGHLAAPSGYDSTGGSFHCRAFILVTPFMHLQEDLVVESSSTVCT